MHKRLKQIMKSNENKWAFKCFAREFEGKAKVEMRLSGIILMEAVAAPATHGTIYLCLLVIKARALWFAFGLFEGCL